MKIAVMRSLPARGFWTGGSRGGPLLLCVDASTYSIGKPRRTPFINNLLQHRTNQPATMADDEDIAALVIDNGSGMCKGTWRGEAKQSTGARDSLGFVTHPRSVIVEKHC